MPSDDLDTKCKHGKDGKKGDGKEEKKHESWYHEWAHSPSFQAALTTVVGLGAVFAGGIGYLQWYKAHVLRRVGCDIREKWLISRSRERSPAVT